MPCIKRHALCVERRCVFVHWCHQVLLLLLLTRDCLYLPLYHCFPVYCSSSNLCIAFSWWSTCAAFVVRRCVRPFTDLTLLILRLQQQCWKVLQEVLTCPARHVALPSWVEPNWTVVILNVTALYSECCVSLKKHLSIILHPNICDKNVLCTAYSTSDAMTSSFVALIQINIT